MLAIILVVAAVVATAVGRSDFNERRASIMPACLSCQGQRNGVENHEDVRTASAGRAANIVAHRIVDVLCL